MIRSPIAYPGGKFKALDIIFSNMPKGFEVEDWREPFFGGGSVTIGFLQSELSRNTKKFVVGDLFVDLYTFWKTLQDNCEELIEAISYMYDKALIANYVESAENEHNEIFKRVKDIVPTNNVELAARFYIINQISFSGLGESVGASRERLSKFNWYSRIDRFRAISRLLQPVEILNVSFEETMKDVTDKTFVFLDPPYILQEKTPLYGKNGECHVDFPHKKLAEMCKNLKCPWLMTIDNSIEARRLYRGMQIKPFNLFYTIANGNSDAYGNGEELLIANYNLMEEQSYDLLASL